MRFFVADRRAGGKRGSHVVLAIALAMGATLTSGLVAEPAFAAKKDKNAPKPQFSKEFIAAFKPMQDGLNADPVDVAAMSALVPGVVAISVSPDEKLATGNAVYSIGVKANDYAMQFKGMTLMIESGKLAPEQLGQFNFAAYQLANALKRYPESRHYLQSAIDANYSSDTVSAAAMQIAMAESYISENRIGDGIQYILTAINKQKETGQAVDETWYRRGLSVAYNNELPAVYDIATAWVGDYPSKVNWRDSINIARNLNTFEPPELLDLMRLSFTLGTMENKQEYIDYIEAADARRLPKEVETLINQAYSSGKVSKDDIFVADTLKLASGRIAADRADLPSLERDARAASAGLRTVTAAGDTFLSYGDNAKAEEFYQKALGMAGVDTATVLTRLGIAQTKLGKIDEAQANFAKVTGKRVSIAKLWSAYAKSKAVATEPVAPTAS
ncbi:MAG: hypothetical protein EP350_02735 [Alphaproteobacteria bacterium]|nr:MAG: hypothetical protein EP350_02735 [Alphaproteobacteria bacterium]